MKKIKLLVQGVTIRLNIRGDFVYLDTIGQEVQVSDEDFLFLREQLNSIPPGFIGIIEDIKQEKQKLENEEKQDSRKKKRTRKRQF